MTSVAFVPGAGDWPVVRGWVAVSGGTFCAKAGVASAVEARSPSVIADERLVMRMPPFGWCDSIATPGLHACQQRRELCLSFIPGPLRSGRGGFRVGIQHWPERLLEWAEVRFVGAPLVCRVAIDRLPHLLGTGRAHGSLGAVEFEARGLELQIAAHLICVPTS